MDESPHLCWFEKFPQCYCGKSAQGILRGDHNDSYGYHCKQCAERRLEASERARQRTGSEFEPLAWLRSEQKRYEALPKLEDGHLQRRAKEFRLSADALETALRERYVCRDTLQAIVAGAPGPRTLAIEALMSTREDGSGRSEG